MSYYGQFSVNGESFGIEADSLRRLRNIAMACGTWCNVFAGPELLGEIDKRGNWHDVRSTDNDSIVLPVDDESLEFWQMANVSVAGG